MLTYANGALFIVFCAAAGILVASRLRVPPLNLPIGILAPAAFALFSGLALAYALFPNFYDHAEPAMTSLGIILLKGRLLYPGLDDYSFHGLLYGPLVAEIQAAALFLGSEIAGLPVILASKLAGLLAFLAASVLFFRVARGWRFARAYYTLFLLPFGTMVFWNRCEPLFLLLVAVGFWAAGAGRMRPALALLILGACAGLASGLKLHGFLYIVPAMAVLLAREKITASAVLLLAAAVATFLLLFLPANVSLPAFFDYLRLAAGHGLSGWIFFVNLIFIGALWSPLVVVFAANGRWRTLPWPPLLMLGVLEVGVAVIGSKPGAGIHHLLPFIPANALIFANCIESSAQEKTPAALDWVWLAMLLPGAVVFATVASNMKRDWTMYRQASQELALIQSKYPDTVMGAAGNNFYPFTFLRPMLEWKGASQVEISSYMDYKQAGLPDTPLQQAFETCRIGHLAVPTREPPFSMRTYYPLAPKLFSDPLRETFARRFVTVAAGAWYYVYECVPRKD